MSESGKLPSLATYKKYDLEEQILSDASLSRWFADICAGKQPTVEVDEVILALMEGHGLVRKRDADWVLAPDGRQFARKLGLIPGPSKFEINPSLIEKIIPKSEAELIPTTDKSELLEKTWKTFAETRDENSRNILMEYYFPLIKHIACRLHEKLPDKVELDDLISAGMFGLMDAIDAYDPSREVGFETYCSLRIRGSILDELRSMDWVPRLVRSHDHQLTRATRALEMRLGRKPTDKEIAKELKLNKEDFERLQRDANAVGLVSLNIEYNEGDSEKEVRETNVIIDRKSKNPLIEAQKRDVKNFLTKELTREERLLIVLYYYDEHTMKEIGAILDLSESRVSQMHSSILGRLKARVHGKSDLLQ